MFTDSPQNIEVYAREMQSFCRIISFNSCVRKIVFCLWNTSLRFGKMWFRLGVVCSLVRENIAPVLYGFFRNVMIDVDNI